MFDRLANSSATILAAGGDDAVATERGSSLGAYTLIAIVIVLLGWMAYLYLNSRRSRAAAHEASPSNLSPPISDIELENKKLTRVLRAALFGSILMAVIMPWYAFNEPGRQIAFAESTVELDTEEGAHWFSVDGFQCVNCHGPGAVGGSNEFTEPRSGITSAWAVPSLNDIFFRYEADEVRHWVVYGRDGTPMPANGLEGGGAMTVQEVDQVIEYLKSIQISQQDAFEKSNSIVSLALTQISGGEKTTQKLINKYTIDIEAVEASPGVLDAVGGLPDDLRDLLQAPGTCTPASAALVNTTCDQPGSDSDRDGLTDEAERGLTEIAAISYAELVVVTGVTGTVTYEFTSQDAYDISFDPQNGFTDGETADLKSAEDLMDHLDSDVLLLNVTVERQDAFFDDLFSGLLFLQNSFAQQLWDFDFDAVAAEMGVPFEDAQLAVGLFNGYCARCHTAGYSAGSPFVQSSGSGAWGPSLIGGKAVLQFPDIADHTAFVVKGSEAASKYGINGLGTGRMPAFGKILSDSQIELIIKYERTL